jgi:hypothetical protein
VLNATQVEDPSGNVIQGVPGLAGKVANRVVEPAGFSVAQETDATSPAPETLVMFEPGARQAAEELAQGVEPQLGPTRAEQMIEEVRALARGAPLALVVGHDDAEF